MTNDIKIEKMHTAHWPAVLEIFKEGITGGNATFTTTAPSWQQWDEGHLQSCRFVATLNDEVMGWIALSPFSSKDCHRGVVEDSIYISHKAQGLGIGSLLLKTCIEESEKENIWLMQSQIFVENESSIYLHKKFGFYEVGVRQKIGKLNGVWRDVLLLDRRSTIAGL
ncbi:GNAT family N-acetyltransferase [Kurthia sibirica]|uniref:N-acetyltransferase n=1 Tax=Kurthia sibirica TaxID=202750 RepID=A0A2U3AKK1_9BACL|nr:GNAT family N-acetyltransferase [Kurthia sibirica]PWI25060.1 N-acetyltransferase [Kurthia sibirica]GEK34225.1 N-acetyltransferase [Kurthia sibirica]